MFVFSDILNYFGDNFLKKNSLNLSSSSLYPVLTDAFLCVTYILFEFTFK